MATSTFEREIVFDDKNSISWATFFYIFSSVLLVVTLAVAMVAVFLKKHPIKVAEKFENDHDLLRIDVLLNKITNGV